MAKKIIIDGLGYQQDTIYEQNPDCYFKKLKRLEKENEELKKIVDCKNGIISTLRNYKVSCFDCEKNKIYRQALEEIREIAKKANEGECISAKNGECRNENGVCWNDPYMSCSCGLDKILDKINEVLND